jgi:hypothetical protein
MMRRAEQKGLFIHGARLCMHGRETKKLRVRVTWRKKDDEPATKLKSRMYIYDVKKTALSRLPLVAS